MTASVLLGVRDRSRHERERLEWTPRTQRAGARRCVVDQVRALQMEPAGAEVADFQRGVRGQRFFNSRVPLLNVLRWRVWIECGEADRGCRQGSSPQDGRTKVQSVGKQRCRRSEVVRLLGLWKHVRHVMALVAPRVLIDRGVEDPIGSVQHQARLREDFWRCQGAARNYGVLAYISPLGRPCWPPMNTEGTPPWKSKLVFVLSRSYSGLVYS